MAVFSLSLLQISNSAALLLFFLFCCCFLPFFSACSVWPAIVRVCVALTEIGDRYCAADARHDSKIILFGSFQTVDRVDPKLPTHVPGAVYVYGAAQPLAQADADGECVAGRRRATSG